MCRNLRKKRPLLRIGSTATLNMTTKSIWLRLNKVCSKPWAYRSKESHLQRSLIQNKKVRRRIMTRAGLPKCHASIVTTSTTNPNTKPKLNNKHSERLKQWQENQFRRRKKSRSSRRMCSDLTFKSLMNCSRSLLKRCNHRERMVAKYEKMPSAKRNKKTPNKRTNQALSKLHRPSLRDRTLLPTRLVSCKKVMSK